MRVARASFAVCLCAGIALSAGAARGADPRLDGVFETTDNLDADNYSRVELLGTIFDTIGLVTGIGTPGAPDGDVVEIDFFTPSPTKITASDVKARIAQKTFSQLTFTIVSDVPARNLDITIFPEKCNVDGSVNMSTGTGKTTVSCSDPSFWDGFTQDQVTSILAAFADNPRVKVKQSSSDTAKGSLSITIKGDAFAAP